MTTRDDPIVPFDSFDRYLRGESTAEDERTIGAWAQRQPDTHALWLHTREAVRRDGRDLAERAISVLRQRIAEAEGRPSNAPRVREPVTGTVLPNGKAWANRGSEGEAGPGRAPRLGLRIWGVGTGLLPRGDRSLPSADRPSIRPSRRHAASRCFTRWHVGAAAASIAVLVIATLWLQTPWRSTQAVTTRAYATARGQRRIVRLPDGTRIILSSATRLYYSVDRNVRTIDLDGEAFFTVSQSAHSPFVVRTGTVTTRVLGTEFDVRHYVGDLMTDVAVVSGRVATGGYIAPVVLAAGAVGHVTDSSVAVSPGEADRATAWTQGRLVFRDVPVSAMLVALGHWYGYEFHLTDTTIAASHISAVLRIDRPVEVLNTVKAVLGVTMTFNGNVITLHPEHGDSNAVRRARVRETLSNLESEVGR